MATGDFGRLFKELRIKAGYTLRQFCIENQFDAGNLSKIERGRVPPPNEPRLREYALALGLQEGSEDWQSLFDYAAAERGQVPEDILNDEELADKLPALFRTIRGGKADGDSLDRLAERIRKA